MSDLDQNKSASRQEVPFRVSLRGIFDAYTRITHDYPISAFEKTATAVDKTTAHMMTGAAAAVTMPLGIIVRNGARIAHSAVNNNGYGIGAGIAGVAGAVGAWWLVGNAAYNALSTTALLGGLTGSVGAMIAAAVVTSPVLSPAFAAGRIAGASLLGTAASVISVLGAAMNLKVGYLRSKDALSGVKYDADTLKLMREPYENGALTKIDEQRRLHSAWNAVSHLTPENREKIYKNLVTEFGKTEETDDAPKKPRRGQTPQPPQI
jgi:hypothetical protein